MKVCLHEKSGKRFVPKGFSRQQTCSLFSQIKGNRRLTFCVVFHTIYCACTKDVATLIEHFYYFSCSCETRNLPTSVKEFGESSLKIVKSRGELVINGMK